MWEHSAGLDPSFSMVWRNLGIGYFNVLHNADASRSAFDRALQANPRDARVLYERDQLWKRIGELPQPLERFPDLVPLRDNLIARIAQDIILS